MEPLSTKISDISVSYLLKPSAKAGPTVVFIHGFPFNKSMWQSQMESLPDGVQGLVFDIRGFGESTTDHRFFSIDLFARDLIELIKALGLETCILCGISMGGYIALRALELSQDNIKGVILCDTNCIADGNESKLKRFTSIQQILNGQKNEFTEAFIKNVFAESTFGDNPDAISSVRKQISSTADETICSALLALASRTDTSASLANIKIPTLVIRGEGDKLMSEEHTRQLIDGIPGAEYESVPNSGHLPNLENPWHFNKTLNTFLNKHFLA
ncbi:alpha/beta fold hydrolase [Paradesertivirga mongoliensis]|uniref:Alpha/beta fold hydrolase n=1 Tax=Paradesertivirga mongoliensis TaxID=2100740 RepID=A0ABW4ZRI1_9SPHI|nr:alpha/beta hydrolase [Pedobacter mongoliensis]